jgi:hypothetical protein
LLDGVLSGVIVVEVPHPYFYGFPRRPQETYFSPFMGHLGDSYLSVGDYTIYKNLLVNETWFDSRWEREYLLHWKLTGTIFHFISSYYYFY